MGQVSIIDPDHLLHKVKTHFFIVINYLKVCKV